MINHREREREKERERERDVRTHTHMNSKQVGTVCVSVCMYMYTIWHASVQVCVFDGLWMWVCMGVCVFFKDKGANPRTVKTRSPPSSPRPQSSSRTHKPAGCMGAWVRG